MIQVFEDCWKNGQLIEKTLKELEKTKSNPFSEDDIL